MKRTIIGKAVEMFSSDSPIKGSVMESRCPKCYRRYRVWWTGSPPKKTTRKCCQLHAMKENGMMEKAKKALTPTTPTA